jgi:AcrR family transcriptional regulator
MSEIAGTRRRKSRRVPLTRERVLDAAVRLADESGIDALSMRRLAKELGVEAMSLYNHVANKDDLLAGITDLVLGEIELPEEGDWKTALRRSALSAHEVLRAHPWACTLALSPGRPPSPGRAVSVSVRRADWMLRQLREGGFSAEVAYHAYHALDAHILGFTLWQLGHGIVDESQIADLAESFFRQFPRAEYPYLYEHARQHLDGFGKGQPGAFVLVLDMILDGLERTREGG